MKLELLQAEIARDEGEVFHAYKDSLGLWTIGIGHLIDPSKGKKPPPEMTWPDGIGNITTNCRIAPIVSSRLFASDCTDVFAKLDRYLPWWRQLDEVRQRVLANMMFNMGWDDPKTPALEGLSGFINTLAFIKSGNYEAAASGMLASKWAKQVGERADRLALMMKTGIAPLVTT